MDYATSNAFHISLTVAVDYTSSNGDPRAPESLHYLHGLNRYATAVKDVAEVLSKYDSDNKIQAFGFGAKLVPGGPVDHCFPLSLSNVEVDGASGVDTAIRRVFERGITMSSPRSFSEVVSTAFAHTLSKNSSSNGGELEYAVLLILTAGCPEDIDGEADAVAGMGRSGPISVVICGVGDGDFDGMDRFIARSHGAASFVRLGAITSKDSKEKTLRVLKDLPDRVVEWGEANGGIVENSKGSYVSIDDSSSDEEGI